MFIFVHGVNDGVDDGVNEINSKPRLNVINGVVGHEIHDVLPGITLFTTQQLPFGTHPFVKGAAGVLEIHSVILCISL